MGTHISKITYLFNVFYTYTQKTQLFIYLFIFPLSNFLYIYYHLHISFSPWIDFYIQVYRYVIKRVYVPYTYGYK